MNHFLFCHSEIRTNQSKVQKEKNTTTLLIECRSLQKLNRFRFLQYLHLRPSIHLIPFLPLKPIAHLHLKQIAQHDFSFSLNHTFIDFHLSLSTLCHSFKDICLRFLWSSSACASNASHFRFNSSQVFESPSNRSFHSPSSFSFSEIAYPSSIPPSSHCFLLCNQFFL